DPAVGVDLDAIKGPVGQAAGVDAGVGQAVDVEVMQPDVPGVGRRDAGRRPLAIRGAVTLAARAGVAVAFHAVSLVGDLQVADLDVGAAIEVEHGGDTLGAPQLGRVFGVLAQDAGLGAGGRTAGDRRQVAVVGATGIAAAALVGGAGGTPADHVAARADHQGVAAGDARGVIGRQGVVGVLPGAGLVGAGAGIGGVGLAGALGSGAAVGAYVVGGGGLRRADGRKGQQKRECELLQGSGCVG